MIFDTQNNARRYFALHPHFEATFKWLQENPNRGEGQYEIAGSDCFVMVQTPSGKGRSTPILEAHNTYLDIQVALEGTDIVGWKSRGDCTNVTQEDSEEKDFMLWEEEPDF